MKRVVVTFTLDVVDEKAGTILIDLSQYGLYELVAAGFVKVRDVEKRSYDIIHYDEEGAHIIRMEKEDG